MKYPYTYWPDLLSLSSTLVGILQSLFNDNCFQYLQSKNGIGFYAVSAQGKLVSIPTESRGCFITYTYLLILLLRRIIFSDSDIIVLKFFSRFQTIVFTVLVLPIRMIFISLFLLLAWVFSTIGLWGLTINDISERPLTEWRR